MKNLKTGILAPGVAEVAIRALRSKCSTRRDALTLRLGRRTVSPTAPMGSSRSPAWKACMYATVDATEAHALDLVHAVAEDRTAAEAKVKDLVSRILRNEPHAVAETKRVVSATSTDTLDAVLDDAARGFARLARSEAAAQGFQAFVTRCPAPWVPDRRDP